MGSGGFTKILELFKDNSFDVKKTLSSLTPETVAPLVKEFLSGANKKSPAHSNAQSVGVSPISNVADKDIVYTLNKYLGEPERI